MLKRTTVRKRMEAQLQEVKENLRQRMHDTVGATGGWLRQVLQAYSQYHSIPGNLEALKRFRERIPQPWRRKSTPSESAEQASRIVAGAIVHALVAQPTDSTSLSRGSF